MWFFFFICGTLGIPKGYIIFTLKHYKHYANNNWLRLSVGDHRSNCQDRPNQPVYLRCVLSIVESRRGMENLCSTPETLMAQPSPQHNFYPPQTSRCLPPEWVRSSSHLLCFFILTYCLVTDDARHSGSWSFLFPEWQEIPEQPPEKTTNYVYVWEGINVYVWV